MGEDADLEDGVVRALSNRLIDVRDRESLGAVRVVRVYSGVDISPGGNRFPVAEFERRRFGAGRREGMVEHQDRALVEIEVYEPHNRGQSKRWLFLFDRV